MADTPAREVSLTGKLFGMSLFGSTVALIILAENLGIRAVIDHAAVILAASLAAAVGLPLLFFRRIRTD
ncbi:MAG: hypothetical protein RMK64_06545 [Rhodovarius sp.]|nr:hypothetical protein [Rhodovarius sp.]MDW8314612.1 hypothetical protein [Rhodovarius sp.]